MKKIEFGQAIGVIANVAVLAGVLLLVYELAQNREVMRAQTRNAISDTLVNLHFTEANSPELLRMYLKVSAGEKLTPYEEAQFVRRNYAFFRYWENVHYQYRNGLYDEGEYFAQREAWRVALLSSKAMRDQWCESTIGHSPQFVVEMNNLLGDARCE